MPESGYSPLTSEESLHHQSAYPPLVRITNDQPTKAYHALSVVPELELSIGHAGIVEQHTHSDRSTLPAREVKGSTANGIPILGVAL